MRTIKFRGKSIDGKEWLYGDLVSSADKKRFAILVNNKESYDECEVAPETVGQFSGLYDYNKKKSMRVIYSNGVMADCMLSSFGKECSMRLLRNVTMAYSVAFLCTH